MKNILFVAMLMGISQQALSLHVTNETGYYITIDITRTTGPHGYIGEYHTVNEGSVEIPTGQTREIYRSDLNLAAYVSHSQGRTYFDIPSHGAFLVRFIDNHVVVTPITPPLRVPSTPLIS
jgi:hypothetical protein